MGDSRLLYDRLKIAVLEKLAKIGGGRSQSFLKKTFRDPSVKGSKAKEIYRALKQDHPGMSAGKKARIAIRRAKKSAVARRIGPPYEGPLSGKR